VLASGYVECIGEEESHIKLDIADESFEKYAPITNHHDALVLLFKKLDKYVNVGLDAIGHRVVHGGKAFHAPIIIDKVVRDDIEALIPLAPLHNSANLEGIDVALALLPKTPQVAVFDTAFHRSLPKHAYLYALPLELYEKHDIRRYGFHGTSHHFVAKESAKFLDKPLENLNLITLHLGNGASATAIEKGKSIDTSMGMTPLEGLMMGTRSGDMDPAIITYLVHKVGMHIDDIDSMLNKQSGLKGICGENDMRSILEKVDKGDKSAQLALEMFVYRIKKYIGAYTIVLEKVDAIVFTGGIGEHASRVRELVCEGLEQTLGVALDSKKNAAYHDSNAEIQSPKSRVKVLVIPTHEELEIAMETKRLLA